MKLELINQNELFCDIQAKRNEIFPQISNLLKLKDSIILNNEEIDRYLSEHEKWHIEEFFDNLVEIPVFKSRQEWHIEYFQKKPFQAIPVNGAISVELIYFDENDEVEKKKFEINKRGTLWYTDKGFQIDIHHIMYSLRQPEDIYVVHLNPEIPKNKKYNISHYIKSGEVERLHFLFASEKTAEYTIRFIFHFNKKEKLKSDLFNIFIYAENRKDYHYDNIKDGNHLVFENGELILK